MKAGDYWARDITYDNLNRPIKITGPQEPLVDQPDTSGFAMEARASYDAVGNLIEVRYSNGPREQFAPVVDAFGNIVTEEDGQFGESQWIKVQYTYDEVNLVTSSRLASLFVHLGFLAPILATCVALRG